MRRWQIGLIGTTAVAFALRLPALFANTFHADEALFASWARLIAVWRDPLLITQAVDKPPLLFYLQAIFYPLQGAVDWAARLPNFIAFVLLVPLMGALVWRLYGDGSTAVATSFIIALSPLAIQFSATAFTDPLMVVLLIVASLQIVMGKSVGAGMWFGLALATKYQAVLFLPLVVGLGWLSSWRRREWGRWLTGFVPIVLVLLVWDVARTGELGLWSAQMGNYGGVRLAFSWELWPRLLAWADLGQYVLGWGWLTAVAVLLIGSYFLTQRHKAKTQRETTKDFFAIRNSQFDYLLLLYVVGYVLLHWLLAVPVWDRYLLPILPLFALLLARSVITLAYHLPFPIRNFLLALFAALILIPAFGARNGRYPIGGFQKADQGASAIAQELQDAPYGTVLYDHWYSWHWRYYFFDKGVYVSWFPYPAALQEDLQAFGRDGNPRYVVLPTTAVALPIHRALTEIGFALEPVTESGNMVLYQLINSDHSMIR